MVFWYRNSILASIVSVFGCCMVLAGLPIFAAGGFVFVVMGVLLAIAGKMISVNVTNKKWLKNLQEQGIDERVRTSYQAACQLYNANPCGFTMKYIQQINPEAAKNIKRQLKG